MIRKRVCSGESMSDVARSLNIPRSTIASRSYREHWPVPSRIIELVRQAQKAIELEPESREAIEAELGSFSVCLKGDPDHLQESEIREILRKKAQAHEDFVATLTSEKIRAAKLPPPKTWRDMKIADDMARRAHGLPDKVATTESAPTVQIGIVGGVVEDISQASVNRRVEGEEEG